MGEKQVYRMPPEDAYTRALEAFLRAREKAIDWGVDVEAVESAEIAAVIELERERSKIQSEKWQALQRSVVSLAVGLFCVLVPLSGRLAHIAAAWYGKKAPPNDLLMDLTCFVGIFAILGLQYPLIMPLVKHFFPKDSAK